MVYGNNIQNHMQNAQLYAALGYTVDQFAQGIAARGGDPTMLAGLADQFQAAAGYHVGAAIGEYMMSGQGFVPSPTYPTNPNVLGGFAQPVNLGSGDAEATLAAMGPRGRAAVERAFGGQIVHGNPNDGVIYVMPFRPGVTPVGAGAQNQAHFHGADYLAGLGMGNTGTGGNALRDIVNRAIQQQIMRDFQSGGNVFNPQGPNSGQAGRGPRGAGAASGNFAGALEGGSFGFQPDTLAQAAATDGTPQNSYAGIMSDPSLTLEDKIALAFMLILKKFDKDIEEQMDRVNAMQNQNGDGGSSIDVEALKLSRMVTKRQQMADILRQIIDKYNQTAKGVIDGIGR